MVSLVYKGTSPQQTLIAVPPIFLALASVILYLRFWARTAKKQKWSFDDYLCLLALITTWAGYIVLVLATVWGGYGIDQKKIPIENIPVVFKLLLAFSITWGCGIASIQLSILSLYLRIFGIITWFRNACYVMIGLVLVWWVSHVVVLVLSCVPLEKFWFPKVPGTCIDQTKFQMGNLISHIILDIIIIAMVLPVIWNMRTSVSNKLTVSFALFLAIFSTACAITRYALVSSQWSNPNATGTRHLGSLFQCLENATGVICCSLPVMTFVFAKFSTGRLSSSLRLLLSRVSSKSNSSKSSSENVSGDHNSESSEELRNVQSA